MDIPKEGKKVETDLEKAYREAMSSKEGSGEDVEGFDMMPSHDRGKGTGSLDISEEKMDLIYEMQEWFDVKITVPEMHDSFIEKIYSVLAGGLDCCWTRIGAGPLCVRWIFLREDYIKNCSFHGLEHSLLHEIGHEYWYRDLSSSEKLLPLGFWNLQELEAEAESFAIQHFSGNFQDYQALWTEVITYDKFGKPVKFQEDFDELKRGEWLDQ